MNSQHLLSWDFLCLVLCFLHPLHLLLGLSAKRAIVHNALFGNDVFKKVATSATDCLGGYEEVTQSCLECCKSCVKKRLFDI
jgi:hypothetical protein